MEYQNKILRQLQELYPHLSLSRLSRLLNIEKTRIHRLFHGKLELRMSEYIRIIRLIYTEQNRIQLSNPKQIYILLTKCLENLPQKEINNLETIMTRKLELNRLLKRDNTPELVNYFMH